MSNASDVLGRKVAQSISAEEQARRHKAVESARRSMQLSGFELDADTEALNASYIAGELTRDELTSAILVLADRMPPPSS